MSDGAWLIVCVLTAGTGWAFIQWQEIKSTQMRDNTRRNRKPPPPPKQRNVEK